MIIGSYQSMRKSGQFKPGDTVWGCNFKVTTDKESMRFSEKPIKGVLTVKRTESSNNEALAKGETYLGYFVPLKKDDISPSWSKAVHLHARQYATTEEECKELYNTLVKKYIGWLNNEIKWAEEQIIKVICTIHTV